MKTIRNTTRRPLKVHLPRGKKLHLGPSKTGQISDDALEQPAVRKLLDAGEIEVVGEGRSEAPGRAAQVREDSHGHHPTTLVHPRGDR